MGRHSCYDIKITKKNDVIYAHCRAEMPQIPTIKYPKKINAIAGIGFGGRTKLKLFEENLTSELYTGCSESD